MHPHVNIAVRAARRAGEIIMRAYDRTDHLRIEEKSHNDFVSEIDQMAEATIIDIISNAYPHDSFLGEEGGEVIKGDPDTVWIIDPLDGTLNYLHHFPHFAVSIAQRKNNRLEHGIIYNPITQELFTATRGEGAMLNGKRMRVSQRGNLKGSLISSNLPNNDPNSLGLYQHFVDKTLNDVAAFRRIDRASINMPRQPNRPIVAAVRRATVATVARNLNDDFGDEPVVVEPVHQAPAPAQAQIAARRIRIKSAVKVLRLGLLNSPLPDTCGICLDSHLKSVTCTLNCKHDFGVECLTGWKNICQTNNKPLNCPTCRENVTTMTTFRQRAPVVRKPKPVVVNIIDVEEELDEPVGPIEVL